MCLAIAGVRLVRVCDGDPGCFTVAGAEFTDPRQSGLPVLDEAGTHGYDGQFFWRLARSPDRLELEPVRGVRFDSSIRAGRPTYPVMAWLAGLGGRANLTDWGLIVVNLLSAAALAGLLAAVSKRGGRSAWFGLAGALWPGMLFALGRDLSEVSAATLVVAGLVLLDHCKRLLAALAWGAAVLAREQSLVIPLAYGLWWLWRFVRHREGAREIAVALAPALFFVTWQAVARSATGEFPALASAEGNAALPLTAFIGTVWDWLSGDAGAVGLAYIAELAVLAVLVGVAARCGFRRWEFVAIVLAALLLVSASESVWSGPAHFRYATDLAVVSWFVLLRHPPSPGSRGNDRRLPWLALAQVAVAAGASSYLIRTP